MLMLPITNPSIIPNPDNTPTLFLDDINGGAMNTTATATSRYVTNSRVIFNCFFMLRPICRKAWINGHLFY